MKKEPLVSIITANYNYGRFLPQCIESALGQTYKNWEYILVDDNSTDNSREIAQEYIDKYPEHNIKLIHNLDGPGGDARPLNMGIKAMKGEYFAWLSSDDYFAPEKLERQVAFMEEHPDIGMTYTRLTAIDDDGKIIKPGSFINPSRPKDVFLTLMKSNFINANTAVIRRSVLEQTRGFIEKNSQYVDIWRAGDYFMWLKLSLLTRITGINEFLHFTRIHRGNRPYNSSEFGGRLKGLLFSMVVRDRDIFALTGSLGLGEEEKVQVEASVRRQLSADGYIDLLLARRDALQKTNPDLNEKVLQKMIDYNKAQYLIKNADIYITGAPERAERQLEEGLELDDRSDIRSIYALASMAKRKGHVETARKLFGEVLKKDFILDSPFVTGAYFHLGEMALEKGDQETARANFMSCVRENPDHAKAAQYLNQLGVDLKLKDYWDKGAERNPFNAIATLDNRKEFELSGVADANMILRHIERKKLGTVLDIGCGIGRVIKALSPVSKKIIGVDTSEGMIAAAQDYLSGVPNTEIHCVKGASTPFENETFDFIYSMMVFMHIPRADFEAWVKEAARVLKKTGIFWFQVYADFGPLPTSPQDHVEAGGKVRAYSKAELEEIAGECFDRIKIFKDPLDRYSGNHWYFVQLRGPKER